LEHNKNLSIRESKVCESSDLYINYPKIKHSGILFMVSTFFVIILAIIFRNYSTGFATGLLAILSVLLPCVIFIKILKLDIKFVQRLNKTSFKNGVLIFLFFVCITPTVGLINYIFMSFMKEFVLGTLPISFKLPEIKESMLVEILSYGLTIPICEEFLYRGFILRSFERIGKWSSILITSFLFMSIHLSVEKFLGLFLLSCLICYIVIQTNSIYSAIIAHSTVNIMLLLISNTIDKSRFDFKEVLSLDFGVIIISILLLAISIFIIVSLNNSQKTADKPKDCIAEKISLRSISFFIPTVLIIYLLIFIKIMLY
jgi:hypothetical protein